MFLAENVAQFEKDGYFVVENFLSKEKCEELRNEIDKIIDSNKFMDEINSIPVFQADGSETDKLARDMYFLTSTDKIRPFLEEKANEILKNDNKENKGPINKKIFNKIGHALHALNPLFKEVTFAQNVKDIFKTLNYHKPVVCQSMYIFKQPFIGGEVQVHQDGSYLHVEPLKICGIWIALEDCTIENGCLHFIPGSNKGQLTRRFIRNPNKEEFDSGKYLIYTGDSPVYEEKEFLAVPVKAGSAIIIDGMVIHKSGANFSPMSRNIYTFHVYESENANFSKNNWMEYSPISFLPLFEI